MWCVRARQVRSPPKPPVMLARALLPSALALPALAGCGDGGFRPMYGSIVGCGRQHRRRAWPQVEIATDSRPRRPAHPQRADLPCHRRRRQDPANAPARGRDPRVGDLGAGAHRWRCAGPDLQPRRELQAGDARRPKVVFEGQSSRGRRSIAIRRSSPMCAPARTPRTAPPAPLPAT